MAVLVPASMQPALLERDLRVRTHVGARARFYLESMIGLAAIRAHSAERAIRLEHENRLAEWFRASRAFVRATATTEGLQLGVGTTLTVAILIQHLSQSSDVGRSLLLVYWCLLLPRIASGLAAAAEQYPAYRNGWLRLLEPLGASEMAAPSPAPDEREVSSSVTGVAVEMKNVEVVAGGHTILSEISIGVSAGEHVGVIGRSGAGKSSFLGILLGWHAPVRGEVRIDRERLDADVLWRLRSETAWVDPSIQIWNRSLLDARPDMAAVIAQADLVQVLENLSEGYRTPLGEGGGLVSGGEGQRVRLASGSAR